MAITRFMLQARTCKLISVLTRLSVLARKSVDGSCSMTVGLLLLRSVLGRVTVVQVR